MTDSHQAECRLLGLASSALGLTLAYFQSGGRQRTAILVTGRFSAEREHHLGGVISSRLTHLR